MNGSKYLSDDKRHGVSRWYLGVDGKNRSLLVSSHTNNEGLILLHASYIGSGIQLALPIDIDKISFRVLC